MSTAYSNDDNELKLTEDDKNDWHGSQTLGAQFEDYAPTKVLSSFVKSTVLIRCWTNS
jgi:hypothetical protein